MKLILVLLCLELAAPLQAAETAVLPPANGRVSLAAELEKSAHVRPLSPGPNDPHIAYLTALMLERIHYLQLPLDAALSSRFLDMYLNTLDPQHIYFLQSDLAAFEKYRATLGDYTLDRQNTSPAYFIFNRFMERLDERAVYVNDVLKEGRFDFTGEAKVMLDRKTQPFPKDMDEARQLWLERVRYEYLQERLAKESNEELAKLIISRHDGMQLALAWHDYHTDIVDTLSRRYGRLLRFYREWDADQVLGTYLTSLAHLYDPHSDFMDRAELENFTIQMSLSLFGIGAVLTSEDGYCKIRDLNHTGPAWKSNKIKTNDCIVAVAQGDQPPVDVVDMPLNKVVDLIRGPKGTEVRLTIVPGEAVDRTTRVVVSLVRDEISLEDQQSKARIIDLPDGKGGKQRLGVIDVPSFYATIPLVDAKDKAEAKSTTTDVNRLLGKLTKEGVTGVILDLRRNGGGSLEEAVNLTGLFIKEGPVVQVKDSQGGVQVDSDTDPAVQYAGPLMVLTSRFSASASEILAGALQDYGRAVLVGDGSTHGKGTVQSLNQLEPFIHRQWPDDPIGNAADFGALKLTTRKFYRASGSSTQLKGVVPDLVLPSVDDYLEIGEASLDNPLKWDTIKPAPEFEKLKLNLVQPYLPELEKRSTERVNAAKDFAYTREDIELVKKALADKSSSLNEVQRLKEKDTEDARRKARDAEVKSRKPLDETIYNITLKDVDLPGLPAPVLRTNVNLAMTGKTPGRGGGASGAVTNSAAAASMAQPVDPYDEGDPTATPDRDADLIEAEHILMDYVSLLPKDVAVVAPN